nr:tetratricopeptide repeat protein [Actinomycetota bacterium]
DPDAFRRARAQFAKSGERRAESAAARELGTLLLAEGEPDDAVDMLADAVALATRAGDLVAVGAAANALGLVHLTARRPDAAVAAFRDAVGAHPRSVRPAEHAMAKANLALAHELGGDARRARLAARQALAVPGVPAPVRDQADAMLARVPDGRGDVVAVSLDEPEDARLAIVREELVRWAEAGPGERRSECDAWVESAPQELAEPLLGALLELPPVEFERVTADLVAAADERFRTAVSSASARFPPPQLLRLERAFRWS